MTFCGQHLLAAAADRAFPRHQRRFDEEGLAQDLRLRGAGLCPDSSRLLPLFRNFGGRDVLFWMGAVLLGAVVVGAVGGGVAVWRQMGGDSRSRLMSRDCLADSEGQRLRKGTMCLGVLGAGALR